MFALPDVEERDGTVAHPAERAIWLRDEVAVADPDLFLGNREIGYFHPWDRSLHIVLPPAQAEAAVDDAVVSSAPPTGRARAM